MKKPENYYFRAKGAGYRARSAYKLLEIDDEFDLFGRRLISFIFTKKRDNELLPFKQLSVRRAVDICAAPGSWSQVMIDSLSSCRTNTYGTSRELFIVNDQPQWTWLCKVNHDLFSFETNLLVKKEKRILSPLDGNEIIHEVHLLPFPQHLATIRKSEYVSYKNNYTNALKLYESQIKILIQLKRSQLIQIKNQRVTICTMSLSRCCDILGVAENLNLLYNSHFHHNPRNFYKNESRINSIVSVDIQPIAPIPYVHTLQNDITSLSTARSITHNLCGYLAELVLCDGAPDVTGIHDLDEYAQFQLIHAAVTVMTHVLSVGGIFVTKIFNVHGSMLLYSQLQLMFESVSIVKPDSSRQKSIESFFVCKRFLGDKFKDLPFICKRRIFEDIITCGIKQSLEDCIIPRRIYDNLNSKSRYRNECYGNKKYIFQLSILLYILFGDISGYNLYQHMDFDNNLRKNESYRKRLDMLYDISVHHIQSL